MATKKDEMLDNRSFICGVGTDLDSHEAAIGYRAIGCCGKPLDYVWNRSCCHGYRRTLDKLLHWWSKKRTGAEAKFHKSDTRNDQLWEYEEGDFKALVRPSYGYVHITLYYK